ncbi:MAG: sulfite exporter TauE/SafE family protein [Saprospiraceae bacterium]|nr:sulfite exporter TauE/SafE family protein [Saprospiraceae bacterium]
MELWTAFTIGLLGSFHCIGMCGPIAASLPYGHRSRLSATSRMMLYQGGRLTTYVLLGLIIGLAGQGMALAGWQSTISVGLGIALLLFAMFSIRIESWLFRNPVFYAVYRWVKERMAGMFRKNGLSAFFSIGLLNGLLPCGLVYVAILGALGLGNSLQSGLYMLLFGLGTLPMLLATSILGHSIDARWRARMRKVVPIILIGLGILLISRGLNFDVPADFRFWDKAQNIIFCH